MSTEEVKRYWATLDQSYLSRYDRLAESLVALIQGDNYDQDTVMMIEDLIDTCKEKSLQVKNEDAWHKAISFSHANDRALD